MFYLSTFGTDTVPLSLTQCSIVLYIYIYYILQCPAQVLICIVAARLWVHLLMLQKSEHKPITKPGLHQPPPHGAAAVLQSSQSVAAPGQIKAKKKKSLTSFLFVELYLQAVCRAAVVQTRGRVHK